MFDLLGIVFPIFAIIALGYGLVRAQVFAAADMRVLGKYVLNVALPALLCGALAKRDLAEVVQPAYMLAFAAAGLGALGLTYAAMAIQGVGPARRAVAAMGASCPNSGFVGYPVMLLVFPDQAGVILALNFVVENFLLIPIGLLLLEFSRPRDARSALGVFGAMILAVLRRPMVIGLLLGLALSVSGIGLPGPMIRLLDVLAASASAVALIVIGGSLVGLQAGGARSLALQIAAAKLVVHPLLAVLALWLLDHLGLPLPAPALATALVLSAAMPMFSIFPLLAQDYGHESLASLALMVATTLSAITLTVALALLL